jgi:hypothetical protein
LHAVKGLTKESFTVH